MKSKMVGLVALAMMSFVSVIASAGAFGGPKSHRDTLLPLGTDTFRLNMKGGETAIIGAMGDDKTDIDCYLYDSDGDLVTSDTDSTSTCFMVTNPKRDVTYTLKVKNTGNKVTHYVIETN